MEAGDVVISADAFQHWLGFLALAGRLRTSGMKRTARWWIGWAGYLAGKDDAADPSLRIGYWRCRYQ
jgi:hypothetical protein